MKKRLLFILSIFIYCYSFCQPADYWQQKVNYKIDVSLNDTAQALDGYIIMQYYNNSPDTLHFIWFHVWPNAYKNDKTAFSDQLLENGKTNFYFSSEEKRGYLNRLDFKVNGITAKTEDHPQHQDIIKLILPQPLPPGSNTKIETAFHVKLPYNFSRGGHVKQSYQITQWYPKPAVYDKKGWHEMPYLDQGEFYSEFGNYEVQITLPKNYVVAATGELQNESEKSWLLERTDEKWGSDFRKLYSGKKTTTYVSPASRNLTTFTGTSKDTISKYNPRSATDLKTLQFKQDNIHDFAWFADKRFAVETDTVQLSSGKIIHCYSYFLPYHDKNWKNSCQSIKKAIVFHSNLLGEYPYENVSAVDVDVDYPGGMEYPMITSISGVKTSAELEDVIEHEVGHNWFYGILATNEREHPWMDEGINSYYDSRYILQQNENGSLKSNTGKSSFMHNRMPGDMLDVLLATMIKTKNDQPIETLSENFSEINYGVVAYHKTAQWMKLLEMELGKPVFDQAMQEYYARWKFKHPYPEDLKSIIQEKNGQNVDSVFSLLNKKGSLQKPIKKDIKVAAFFSLKETDKHHYIFISPAIGYNNYDKFMAGILLHNYTLPPSRFKFIVAPLYATGSKQLNGIGNINFSTYRDNCINKIVLGVTAARFSTKQSLDTFGNKIFENFYKIVPSLQLYFKHPPRSQLVTWLDLRTYLIGEQQFDNNSYVYKAGSDSTVSYPLRTTTANRYINEISFNIEDTRVLYPYDGQLKFQQGKGFYRVDLNANYFFNYPKSGGMRVRLFASKFGYLGEKSFSTYQYWPKLLAATGDDDYTYSNYFIGRTASTANSEFPVKNLGIGAHQVMMRDGGLKLRLDQFEYLQGRSDNWVAALNFNTTLPDLFPVKLPLRLFFDVGTNAETWKDNSQLSRFLYVGGLQLSLFKNVLNIYAPFVYSKDFKNILKSQPDQNTFFKRMTFSIDIQNISFRKLFSKIPL